MTTDRTALEEKAREIEVERQKRSAVKALADYIQSENERLRAENAELRAVVDIRSDTKCKHDKLPGECDECWKLYEAGNKMVCPYCGDEELGKDGDKCLTYALRDISELRSQLSRARDEGFNEGVEAAAILAGNHVVDATDKVAGNWVAIDIVERLRSLKRPVQAGLASPIRGEAAP